MNLENPEFDQRAYLKRLESKIYLTLVAPLTFFGWVFLDRESSGQLKTSFWDNPDLMFHGAMLIGIVYVLSRTLLKWKSTALESLKRVKTIDVKLRSLGKAILYRNILWAIGAMIAAYGLYVKGDMFYVMFFTIFLVLITANRPSANYFIKFFQLKEEEKEWMQK
jgi:hypothetical protein